MAINIDDYNTKTEVKFLSQGIASGPQISNNFGTCLPVLKAVLVDGYAEQTTTVFTTDSSTLTLTLPNHSYPQYTVVDLKFSSNSSYNGEYRVISSGQSTVTVKLPSGSVTPGQTITIKVAPLGWTLSHNSISQFGLACFTNAKGHTLRVIDAMPKFQYNQAWTKFMRLTAGRGVDSKGDFLTDRIPYTADRVMYNAGYDANLQVDPGSSAIQMWATHVYAGSSNGYSYPAFNNPPNNMNRQWHVVGNENFFILRTQAYSFEAWSHLCFGAFDPKKDVFVLGCTESYRTWGDNSGTVTWGGFNSYFHLPNTTNITTGGFISENSLGYLEAALRCRMVSPYGAATSQPGSARFGSGFDPLSGEIYSSPVLIQDSNGSFRGSLNGINWALGSFSGTPTGTPLKGGRYILFPVGNAEVAYGTPYDNYLLINMETWR